MTLKDSYKKNSYNVSKKVFKKNLSGKFLLRHVNLFLGKFSNISLRGNSAIFQRTPVSVTFVIGIKAAGGIGKLNMLSVT